jgi:drug/metabolite transporter (DMT)-like permease
MMGYLYAFLAFLMIGSYLVPLRFARPKGDAFLALMGAGMLACLPFFAPQLAEIARHPLWLGAGILSGMLWAVAQGLANRAVGEVSFAKAVVVFNLNTFVNIAAGLFLFQEAASLKAAATLTAGGVVLFSGAALVAGAQAAPAAEGDRRRGLLLAAAAGLLWGVYFIPMQWAKRMAPAPGLGEAHLLAALLLGGSVSAVLLGVRALRRSGAGRRDLAWGAAAAVLWTAGTAFFLLAIREMGLARAVPLINSNTLMYAGWSLFVFRELPLHQSWRVLSGALLAVAGAAILASA